MASPVSIGDAFLMAKLCWTLAQTFTKGRKSAPAEFREVENQLYSLSAALSALRDARKDDRAVLSIVLPKSSDDSEGDGKHTIDKIIRNCGETLHHLEEIVLKYGEISGENKNKDDKLPLFKRWGGDLSRNWKKIAWTTEKGDLSALRSQIAVHTNSLNLVLAIVINSQTTRIEERLASNSLLIQELHDWSKEYLQDGKPIRVQSIPSAAGGGGIGTANAPSTSAAPPPPGPAPQFAIYIETSQGSLQLVCPGAAFLAAAGTTHNASGSGFEPGSSPFVCCCGGASPQLIGASPHHHAVTSLQFSKMTFPVRLAGSEASWILYRMADTSRNRLCSVHIKNVPATYFAEFEETFIESLALRRAEEIFKTGSGNMLAYLESDAETEEHDWRILSMTTDLRNIQNLIDSVTFDYGRRSFTPQNSVAAVSMLHYTSIRQPPDNDDGSDDGFDDDVTMVPEAETHHLRRLPHAEILITFDHDDEEVGDQGVAADTEKLLLLKYNTKLKLDASNATVVLSGIACRSHVTQPSSLADDGSKQSSSSSRVDIMDVTFQLTTSDASTNFHKRIEEMRMELFVLSLQDPRESEDTLLKIQVTQVECEDIYIPEAEISILQDRKTAKHRMAIVSSNRCTTLSQMLAEDFFASSPSSLHRTKLNLASPTWLVQLEGAGRRRVYRYEHGLRDLTFRNMQSDRVFELALNTISGSLPLRPASQNRQQLSGPDGS